MSEKNYIDDDFLLSKVIEKYKYSKGEARKAYRDVIDMICAAPAADVEEAKHGYWKMCYYPNDEHVECSECHTQYYENDLYLGGNEFPKRCPECGAKMDGGKNE